MPRATLFILCTLATFFCYSQNVSLQDFCPTKQGQYEATCFAYASTYTALSIAYNVKSNARDESSPDFKVFSDGFVASKIKRDKKGINRIFNRCGKYADVDLALGVLLENGTVLKSDFEHGCRASDVEKFMSQASEYRIKDTVVLSKQNISTDENINLIVESIKTFRPVIVAIFQDEVFRDNDKFHFDLPDTYSMNASEANHVVCVVGFDGDLNGGSFLIKNNYLDWGDKGFAYIPYRDFMKVVRYSYCIEI